MPDTYDRDRPITWPAEDKAFSQRVWLALVDGDLQPLAEYLRSPLPVDRGLREDIARCIEGRGTLHQIVTTSTNGRPGSKSVRREIEAFVLKMAIVDFVDCLMDPAAGPEASPPCRPKKAESITAEVFGISLSSVQNARRSIKEGQGPTFSMAGWDAYQKGSRSRW